MKLLSLLTLSLAFSALVYAQDVEYENFHEEINNLGRILGDYQTVTTATNMMYGTPVTTTASNMYGTPVTTTSNVYGSPVTTTSSNIYSTPVTSNPYSSPVASSNCPVNCPPVVKAELGHALKALLRITDVSNLIIFENVR